MTKKKHRDARRKIAVFSSSRADFSHLHWPLACIRAHPDLDLQLLVGGPHLAPEFGATADEIVAAGFHIDERIECLLSSDTDVGMAKTIGIAALGLADALARRRPDIFLLIADRYEMLAPAAVALAMRIPVAHIEGGEISEGAIDDAVRNALSKMAHLHFAPTEAARQRVLALGEEAWRVHKCGAPSLDHLRRGQIPDRRELAKRLGIALDENYVVAACHPVTLLADTNRESEAFFAALEAEAGQIFFCFPNADAGGRELIRRTRQFCAQHRNAQIFVNLPATDYWALLKNASMMLGNSSSGIMETPALGLPTVNVGLRQHGRQRAANIIDADADREAIQGAMRQARSAAFREIAQNAVNPYGDGHAGERIADTLASCPVGEALLRKRALALYADAAAGIYGFRQRAGE